MSELQRYSFGQLCARPSVNAWSLGQVCMHILEDSGFYLEQIHQCVAESDNHDKAATPDGRKMLDDNAFPDVAIEGAPGSSVHAATCQQREVDCGYV